jgi:NADH:ubiquinone reductase (H+-translocating)
MKANISETDRKRIVIIGGGFAGLRLLRDLVDSDYQIVLVDRNNFHQFQPLFYQVATAGLEPSAIAFPFRKFFQSLKNVHIRVADVTRISPSENCIYTSIGLINYDYLVLATGANTNFFGNKHFVDFAYPMKSLSEAVALRNNILENFERALTSNDPDEKAGLMNLAIIGGGPTGVELAGALAEMKKFILPKDYPELDFTKMKISLIEAGGKLLKGMSEISSKKAYDYLISLGVEIHLHTRVTEYDRKNIFLGQESKLRTDTLIWTAGVTGNLIDGIKTDILVSNNRYKVDKSNKIEAYSNIYAIGDIACMEDHENPEGHPQVAQVAIQQAKVLAQNFKRIKKNKALLSFHYRDLGSMATVGRHLAVVDLPGIRFQGFFAWLFWMFVHLMSIVGVKNRILIFINWLWNYITYDQSLRLIIKPAKRSTN